MIPPQIPPDESSRLAALRALNILDTPSEERFDRLTRLAQRTFNVPIALISLVDENRQWFKSCQGLLVTETTRDVSFCGHAILESALMIVPDTTKDSRFSDNPLVTGEPFIRFYAGQPLQAPNGRRIGTLCLIDRVPRELDNEQRRALRDLAEMAEEQLAGGSDETDAPADEHSRLLARLRLSPEHAAARLKLRAGFVGIMVTLAVVTGFTFRLANRLVADSDRLAPVVAAARGPEAADAGLMLEGVRSTARFFRAAIGARALLATGVLFIVLIIFDRHMDARLSAMAAVELDHARLRAVIDAIGDGVVVADAGGRFTVFNPAAERILGHGLVNKPDQTAAFYGSFFHENGDPCPPEKHPLARAIIGQTAHGEHLVVRNERRPGGVPVIVTATPVHSFDGAPAGGVTIFRDVL